MLNLPKALAREMALKQDEIFAKLDFYSKKFGDSFIIALSGGADSLCLAKLCAAWQKTNSKSRFKAIIVNHNLSENSHEICENAKLTAQNFGLEAEICEIKEKIESAIEEKARNLRYEILTQKAKEFDANLILLGHNFDDVIETFIFRLSKRTSLLGLGSIAEIAPPHHWQSNFFGFLARPLIGQNRDDIRKYLQNENIQFHDDIMNENQKFSRVFIRKNIIPRLGNKRREIGNFIKTAIEFRNFTRFEAFKIIMPSLRNDNIEIPQSIFHDCHELVAGEILNLIISNHCFLVASIRTNKIQALLNKIKSENFKAATLGNVKIQNKRQILHFSLAKSHRGQENPRPNFKQIWQRFNSLYRLYCD